MKLLAGTSGFAFKEWKGPFYPADLKDDAMLGFYAGRFPTVEINNTFYRLPREQVLLDWASRVPDTFTFAIKASQRITHFARLKPTLPTDRRYTVEFRHESWFDDEVYAVLRERDIPLCVTEQPDFASPIVTTASWGYVRLHRLDYDAQLLDEWSRRIASQPWTDAFVYFKHDEGIGSGPPAVDAFIESFDKAPTA
jgi:uncharacterized protein YecE (DUF72 family)